MLGAIYTGLSGMNTYSDGLMMISNDVANLNTLGYKGNTMTFNSLFQQGGSFLGSTGGSGYGVSMGSSFIDFSQGTLQQTTNPLDLAIQGNGFLTVLKDGKTYFERTGNFFVGQDGFISDAQGNHLGTLDGNGQVVPFSINGFKTSDPVATTKFSLAGNIGSDGLDEDGNEDPTTVHVKVFDSRGGSHDWTVTFTPAGQNTYEMTVKDENGNLLEDPNIIDDPDTASDESATHLLHFDGSGHLTDDVTSFVFAQQVDGAEDLGVTMDLSSTEFKALNGATSVGVTDVDGNAMGTLTGVGITAEGDVELVYSNGKTVTKGAVALAYFQDPQMLHRMNGGLYTDPSGQPVTFHASGKGGVGTLMSGQVEASNVNLSSEFGQLILIERGFQACSQIVSISNEMIQTLFGMRGQG